MGKLLSKLHELLGRLRKLLGKLLRRRKLRELRWKDFCDGLDKDPPDDVQKEAEHVFFDHVFPEALLTFFQNASELLLLYEAALSAPAMKPIADAKFNELFKQNPIPFYESLMPVLKNMGAEPEKATFLEICAFLTTYKS
jgi:hypothetical protein